VLTEEQRTEIQREVESRISELLQSRLSSAQAQPLEPLVRVVARAVEVLGTSEKALRWLNTPIRSLGDQTPTSLLGNPEGIVRVEDALGRIEHGVW
jgi:putative toxin-antitoxin system antitoxin component (TIGR02293 family)